MSENKLKNWLILFFIVIIAVIVYFSSSPSKSDSTSQKTNNPIFDSLQSTTSIWYSPTEIHNILSENGIGRLKEWRYDGYGWIASTNFFDFGKANPNTLMKSNIAYYMAGTIEDKVDYITIILNLNNSDEINKGNDLLKSVVNKTFDKLHFEMPPDIFQKLKNMLDFEYSNEQYKLKFDFDANKIKSWTLRIYSPNS